MSNIFISELKYYLENYFKKQTQLNEEISDNFKRFSPEYAAVENEKLATKQEEIYLETKRKIVDEFKEIRELLARANFPDSKELTPDKMLFDSGIKFSSEEIKAFLSRYVSNHTMTRLIADYLEKNGGNGEYADIQITTPRDILQGYKTFVTGAIDTVEKIHNGTVNELELKSCADENFCKNLFDLVGDGFNLRDLSQKKVPESALHAFDDVQLIQPDANNYSVIA